MALLSLIPWLAAQSPNGTVINSQLISNNEGNFGGTLDTYEAFGRAAASIGDLDGDGVDDLAVGAPGRSSSATTDGALWILLMNADGTVKAEQKIDGSNGNFTGNLSGQEALGHSLAYLGDLDGDGRPELAVGAPGNTDAQGLNPADSGAVYILSLDADGTVQQHTLIRNNTGGLPDVLDNGDHFGYAVANAGDLDGDGRPELAVGAWGHGPGRGAVYVLFLNSDGTVDRHQRISQTEGNFNRTLGNSYHFGCSLTPIEDLNRDGLPDLAVGAYGSDEGGSFRGAVWLLRMQPDGTVTSGSTVINGAHPLLSDTLSDFDYFGYAVQQIGDLDGDGRGELAVGAPRTNTAGTGSGEGRIYLLYLDGNGGLRDFSSISEDEGNLNQSLSSFAGLGSALADPGDLDGDGIGDLWAGLPGYNGGISGRGGLLRLTLDGQGEAEVQGSALIFDREGQIQPLSGGMAYLFDLYDEDPDLFGHDTTARTNVDGNGNFRFRNIPLRDYFLKVVPPSDTLMDGYYVADSALRFRSHSLRDVLSVQGDTALLDIFVVERQPARPNLYSYIGYLKASPGRNKNDDLDTARQVPILLRVAGADSLVDYTRSDSNGFFVIDNMQPGGSYDLQVDVPGLPMDSATALNFTYPTSGDSLPIEILIDTAAIFVDFNPATNLRTAAAQPQLQVGPVPARDYLTVRWPGPGNEGVSYRVRDLRGRELRRAQGRRNQPLELNLQGLAPGVYLLEARSDAGVWLRKFRKE